MPNTIYTPKMLVVVNPNLIPSMIDDMTDNIGTSLVKNEWYISGNLVDNQGHEVANHPEELDPYIDIIDATKGTFRIRQNSNPPALFTSGACALIFKTDMPAVASHILATYDVHFAVELDPSSPLVLAGWGHID